MNGDMDMESESTVIVRRPRRRSLPLEDDDEMNEVGRRGLNAFNRLVDIKNKGLQEPYAQEIVDEGRYNIGRAWDELNRQYEASRGNTVVGREARKERRNSFDTIVGDLSMAGTSAWGQLPEQQQEWLRQQQQQQIQQHHWEQQQQQQWQPEQQHQNQIHQQQQQNQQHQHQYGGVLEGSPTQQGVFFGKRRREAADDASYEFTSPQRHKQRRNSSSCSQLSPLFQREPQHISPVEGFLPPTFGMRNSYQQHSSMQQ